MADTVTTSYEAKFEWLFLDGDTRTFTLKNPPEEIDVTDISNLQTLILNGGQSTLLIGDKTGAVFRRINSVTRVNTTKTELDLT